jgi:hypothetical protein
VASISQWSIEAQHPDEFLVHLYDLDPVVVISKLQDQCMTIGRSLPELLRTLRTGVPRFAGAIASKLALEIPPARL